jgi:hypothetical protein
MKILQVIISFLRQSPAVINSDLEKKIVELFFPESSATLDVGPSSSSPFAKELAELFVSGEACDKQFLTRAEVFDGFVTMATAYARRTPLIQTLGNSFFRQIMIIFFGLKTPLSDSLEAKDKRILGLCSAIAAKTESEQLEHQMSPVCCPDDENPPLLRSKTTTPETMLQSMGQALLEWDKDTEEFFHSIFTDLFDFIAPGAVSVSKRELEDIADAAGERCEEACELLLKYQPLWMLHGNDSLSRVAVRSIFTQLSSRILCQQDWFSVPVNAYIRRKLRPVIHAVESKKVYEEGKQYVILVSFSRGTTTPTRCRLLKRLDVQKFRIEFTNLNTGALQTGHVSKLYEVDDPELAGFLDDDDDDDWPETPPNQLARPILKHMWAHLDWSDAAYERDIQFALRSIAADFPRFLLGNKVPEPVIGNYWVKFKGPGKLRMDFDLLDYGISFAPFCTRDFLPSLSAEDHKRLMETAAMRESFRCFFLHLAVELGVHPVALQVTPHDLIAAVSTPLPPPSLPPPFCLQHVCRQRCAVLSQTIAERTAADEDTELQLFGESVNSVLERGCNRYLQSIA